jgi:hypothetical protein
MIINVNFFRAIAHFGKFDYVPLATAVNLVMRNGPLWRAWLCAMGDCVEWSCTIKISDNFHAMSIAQDLIKVLRHGPQRRIWVCNMVHWCLLLPPLVLVTIRPTHLVKGTNCRPHVRSILYCGQPNFVTISPVLPCMFCNKFSMTHIGTIFHYKQCIKKN